MNDSKEILTEYNSKHKLYEEYCDKLRLLINDILVNEKISFQKIENRVKNYESLSNKIIKKDKYNALSEVKDVIGLRIILFYTEDIDKVRTIMEKEFECDLANYSDKREKEYNVFGYSSLHLILKINNKRSELLEYKKYQNIYFELQIRTILQHAWAEIEHDLGYKTLVEIPLNIKRGFARLAGLIEIADDEFVRLRKDILHYENQLGLAENETKNEITKDNLIYLFTNNIHISQILNSIAEKTGFKIDNNHLSRNINPIIANLLNTGFDTIIKIIKFIEDNENNINELATNTLLLYHNKHNVDVIISSSLVIRYMILFFILKVDNTEFTNWYFRQNNLDNRFTKILKEEYAEITKT